MGLQWTVGLGMGAFAASRAIGPHLFGMGLHWKSPTVVYMHSARGDSVGVVKCAPPVLWIAKSDPSRRVCVCLPLPWDVWRRVEGHPFVSPM